MKLRLIAVFALTLAASAEMRDHGNYKDPALFTRMPHYFLNDEGSLVDTPFDAFDFTLKSGTQRVEGHHLKYTYTFDETAGPNPGFLQIIRNYQAAARKIGGQVLSDDGTRRTALKVTKNGAETWVAVEAFNEGRSYDVDIIEKQAMVQDVVADAAALQSGLKENGHIAVTGIFFDTGKAELKAESEAALTQMIALLKADRSLRVWVVGHTDNTGQADSNITLSAARAGAVVKALVGKGVEAPRLAAHGAGPYAPVAPNDTEEGRARNRRVELVSQP
jgi:OmpA-OmpF porin, OOP family